MDFQEFIYRHPRTGRRWTLMLPPTAGHQRVAAMAARSGIAATTQDGVRSRPVDAPLQGRVAIVQRDEREAKYAKPIALYSHIDGRPLLLMGMGVEHLGDLIDKEAEIRHYGEDRLEIPTPRPDVNAIFQHNVWLARRRAEGTITYGAETKGRL